MYLTHNPGFCYHCNGNQKQCDSMATACQEPNYQEIVDLLFTNGELDTDKVLCLHAVATHPAYDSTKLSCKAPLPLSHSHHHPHQAVSFLTHDQSALDRLIERSRARTSTAHSTNTAVLSARTTLPAYVLNLDKENRNKSMYDQKRRSFECCGGGRLATRFIVNENLMRLVYTVMEALHLSNPRKLVSLMRMAQNPNNIMNIINKPEMQGFLKYLSKNNIILSSDSFHLSAPITRSVNLNVEHPTRDLEKLIKQIRNNVLKQNPNYRAQQISNFAENEKSLALQKETNKDKKEAKPRIKPTKLQNQFKLENSMMEYYRTKRFDAEKVAILLSEKIREAHEQDLKELRKTLRISNSSVPPGTPNASSSSIQQNELDTSVSLKRSSKCIACREGWRNSLPRKNTVFKSNPASFKNSISRSTQWLTTIIEEEEKKLNIQAMQKHNKKDVMKKKQVTPKRPINENSRRSSYLMRKAKKYSQYFGYKTGEASHVVNNLNLAKIQNEIFVTENHKKIRKFLEEPFLNW